MSRAHSSCSHARPWAWSGLIYALVKRWEKPSQARQTFTHKLLSCSFVVSANKFRGGDKGEMMKKVLRCHWSEGTEKTSNFSPLLQEENENWKEIKQERQREKEKVRNSLQTVQLWQSRKENRAVQRGDGSSFRIMTFPQPIACAKVQLTQGGSNDSRRFNPIYASLLVTKKSSLDTTFLSLAGTKGPFSALRSSKDFV